MWPHEVKDPGSAMVIYADDWLAVVLIDNYGVAHKRDSGAIPPAVLAASLRELAHRIEAES